MSTTIRAEISEKNKYFLEKHRYYELRHFCLQYPAWKEYIRYLDGLSKHSVNTPVNRTNKFNSPTEDCVLDRQRYVDKVQMVESVASSVDNILGTYILKGVTQGLSYNKLCVKEQVPCCKETYYKLYREFFWLLDKVRE